MNNIRRKVKFSTIINIIKERPFPFFFGLGFGIFPILMLIPIYFLPDSPGISVPDIDYDLINEQGTVQSAVITDIEPQYNITENGVNPTIISYEYSNKKIKSKYRVLEESKIANLNIGDTIEIKEYNGNTIINNIESFDFPDNIFYFFPLFFLLIGSPFLTYALLKFRKKIKLYKEGKVSSGKIVSMIPKLGRSFSNWGNGIIVHYEYENRNGNKTIIESFTSDFSIINDNKKGDFVPIFVSLENEENSCIVPKIESLRNNWNIEFD